MDERFEFLYNSMLEAGHDMGDRKDFAQSLSGIEAQRFVFDSLKDAHDLGDFNSFQANLAESYKGQGFSPVPNVGFVPSPPKENKIPTEQSQTARVYKQAIADRSLGFDLDTVINDEGETWRDHMDQAARNNALPDFLDRIGAGQALPQETQAIHQAIADDPRTSLEVAREESPTFKVLGQLRVQPGQEEEFQADVNDLFESVYDKGTLGKLSEGLSAFTTQTLLGTVDFTKSRAENAIEDLEEKYELVLNDEFKDGLATSLANEFDQQRGGASLVGSLAGFILPAGVTIKGVQRGLKLALPNSKFTQLFQAGSGGQVAGFTRNALETLPADILDAYNIATDREGNFNMGQFYLQIAADMGLGGIIGTSLEGIFKAKVRNADFSKEGEFERIKSEMEGEAQQIKNIEEGTDVGELKTEKLPEQETITETISPEQTAKLDAVPEPAKVSTEVSESGNVIAKDTDNSNQIGDRGDEAAIPVTGTSAIKQFVDNLRFGKHNEPQTQQQINDARAIDVDTDIKSITDSKQIEPNELERVRDLISKDEREFTPEQNEQLFIYLKELDGDPKLRNEFTFEQLKNNQKILKKISQIRSGEKLGRVAKATKNAVGIILDELNRINPVLKDAVNNTDFALHEASNRTLDLSKPFIRKYNNLDNDQRRQLWFALSNASKDAGKLAKEFKMTDELNQVKGLLEELRVGLSAVRGKEVVALENFFPRKVKDVDELARVHGFETNDLVKQALKRHADSKNISVKNLSQEEKLAVIKNVLENNFDDLATGKGAQQRKIQEVTETQRASYSELDEALVAYLERTNREIIMGKSFDTVVDDIGDLNFGAYIQSLVGKEVTRAQSNRVLDLLKSWANPKQGSVLEESFANFQYLDYLSQYGAYIRQFGDIASATYRHGIPQGFKGTSQAALAGFRDIANRLLPEGAKLPKRTIELIDIGLDKINEEIISTSLGSFQKKILNVGLKGFAFTDRVGKNAILNSGYAYFQKVAKMDPRNAAHKRLKEDLTRLFRTEERVNGILNDFKTKKGFEAAENRDIKILLWNELADVQPISRAAHSKAYLDAQGLAKVPYRFKTFALRRGNMILTHALDPRIGNVAKAGRIAKALAYYTTIEGSVDLLIDYAYGKELDPAESYLNGVLGLTLLHTYDNMKLQREGIRDTLIDKLLPSGTIINDLERYVKQLSNPEVDADEGRLVKHIPVVGRLLFNQFFDDAGKATKRRR